MGFSSSRDSLRRENDAKSESLRNISRGSWFTSDFGSYDDILGLFDSGEENDRVVEAKDDGDAFFRYMSGMKLAFTCAMRKEFRSQYMGTGDEPFTDIDPFRRGVLSAREVSMFDDALNASAGD